MEGGEIIGATEGYYMILLINLKSILIGINEFFKGDIFIDYSFYISLYPSSRER